MVKVILEAVQLLSSWRKDVWRRHQRKNNCCCHPRWRKLLLSSQRQDNGCCHATGGTIAVILKEGQLLLSSSKNKACSHPRWTWTNSSTIAILWRTNGVAILEGGHLLLSSERKDNCCWHQKGKIVAVVICEEGQQLLPLQRMLRTTAVIMLKEEQLLLPYLNCCGQCYNCVSQDCRQKNWRELQMKQLL